MLGRLYKYRRILLLVGCVTVAGGALVILHKITNILDVIWFILHPSSRFLPLSLHCNDGRLGNQMCSYATLYGISALNQRRSFVVLDCNVRYLSEHFDGPRKSKSMSPYLYFRWNPWILCPFLREEDFHIPAHTNFVEGMKHPCSYTFFDHVKEEIRREFQFQDHLLEYAQSVLRKANSGRVPNVTYVGVHVRRGDYQKKWLEAFDGVPVDMKYFRRATSYFRNKYQHVIFVAVSEDRLWCIKHLSSNFGMFVPEEAPSAVHDLAVLASCNHSILSYGTFGFWGAYLAGGEVVYFDQFLRPGTLFTRKRFIFDKMYPKDWVSIVTVNESHWVETDALTETPNPQEVLLDEQLKICYP